LSDANAIAGVLTPAAVLSTAFGLGTTDVIAKFAFAPSPNSQTIKLRATEAGGDGVSSNPASVPAPLATPSEGTTLINSGRIMVSNAHGSERLPLNLKATLQIFGAGSWLTSAQDKETVLALPANYNVGSGTSTANFSLVTVNAVACGAQVAAGTAYCGLWAIGLTAPASTGFATINPIAPLYLPVTTGRATFGVYSGNPKIIDMRESF
jgi:hypothetical protein